MTYIVLDDVVSEESQTAISNYLFGENANWKFARFFAYKDNPEVDDEKRKTMFNFSCIIYDNYNQEQQYISIFLKLIDEISSKIPWKLDYIFKIRSEMQLPIITENRRGNIHVDCHAPDPYVVVLYYVNDSDGDTILYNETTKDITTEEAREGKVTENIRIKPKKGRVLIFDGNTYHAGTKPTKDIRCILNYNISIV